MAKVETATSASKQICLYLHVHQPYRLRKVNFLELAKIDGYFANGRNEDNPEILRKVIRKSYKPTLKVLLKQLQRDPEFAFSLSITGTVLEQLQEISPVTLALFKEASATGRMEILGETYYHSLAAMYDAGQFAQQVQQHSEAIWREFGQKPTIFRNTELIYSDEIASYVAELGFEAMLAEGWEGYLEWRSSNYVYSAEPTKLSKETQSQLHTFVPWKRKANPDLKLLLKNYRLSDDIAFRFSDRHWSQHPLTVEKFLDWVEKAPGELVNLFMDFETFGEHQWEDSGIFEFLKALLPAARKRGHQFVTASAAAKLPSAGKLSVPNLSSWADSERDVSAWNGNRMQQSALRFCYGLGVKLASLEDRGKAAPAKLPEYFDTWYKLQTSDHFYYMSTKYWRDGDVHKYFSPYDTPYEAFINYMNIAEDFGQLLDYEIQRTAHADRSKPG